MSKNRRRFQNRFSTVSPAQLTGKTSPSKTPLKNGENGKNGDAPAARHKDARGRFVSGNPGGPGRPRKPSQSEYHTATLSAIAVDGWERVVAKALEDAQAGDKHARRWLSDYVVGHPTTPAVVDGVPAATLERVISLLRAAGHDPEQVFANLILRLEQSSEGLTV